MSSQDVRYQERVWVKFSQPWGTFCLLSAASWEVYKALLKLVRWILSCALLMSMLEAFPVTSTLNKIYTKVLVTETVFGFGFKSSALETMISWHHSTSAIRREIVFIQREMRYSVWLIPHVDIFLIYLWHEGELHVLILYHLDYSPTRRVCFPTAFQISPNIRTKKNLKSLIQSTKENHATKFRRGELGSVQENSSVKNCFYF